MANTLGTTTDHGWDPLTPSHRGFGLADINRKLDQILERLSPAESGVEDNWRNWQSVMDGCSYNGGTLEADYTEQGVWRIKMIQGDYTQPMYVPSQIDAQSINVWWAENQDVFMEDAMASIEAYKGIGL